MKTFSKHILFCLVIGALSQLLNKAFSQISQPDRYEIELSANDNYFYVITADTLGLFLVREKSERFNRTMDEVEVIFLDTKFDKIWETSISVENNLKLVGYDFMNGKMNLLLIENEDFLRKFIMVEFEPSSPEFTIFPFENVIPLSLTQFEMVENGAIIGGQLESKPVLLLLEKGNKRPKIIPGFYREKSELLQVSTKQSKGLFQVLTTEVSPQRRKKVTLHTFTSELENLVNLNLEHNDYHFLDAQIGGENYSNQILSGTYSDRKNEYSKGLFIAKLKNVEIEDIHYVSYADLDNFFNYMKERRKNRIKERIKRKRIKGKRIRLKYRMQVQDIINYGEYTVVLGEAYYPQYKSNTYNSFSAYDIPRYNNYYYDPSRTFDGYHYTHAVIIGLDKNGKVLWDNSFEINDAKSFDLTNFVKVSKRENDIVLLYLYDHIIKTKIIRGNEIVSGKNEIDINLPNQNDEVRYKFEDYEGLEKWYGEHSFYAYGVQRIKNLRDNDVPLNRKVFFINKIVVEP